MMKQIPTQEQILDALQTHKTLYRAAYKFGVTTPTLKRWMKRYGIVTDHNVKQPEPHVQRLPWYKCMVTNHNVKQPRLPWYKRIFAKKHPVPSG